MTETRICKGCSQPIEGRYLTALDADWHPEHFCCAVCKLPLESAQFYMHEGEACHTACFENAFAPRCSICDKALTGKYQVNHWGDNYCTDHEKELASCSYCGRLVAQATKRTRRRSVENISCDVCNSTGVISAETAKEIMPNLIAWLEGQGVRLPKKAFRIEVLDRYEFNERDTGHRDPLGITVRRQYVRNNRVISAEIEGVALLSGLPLTLFEGVCVHELGHVWLVQKGIVNLPSIDEEGFCELLSHRRYVEIGSKADLYYAERIARNGSPIYGDGFRKLKKLEERVGFSQIIKSLIRKKKLPL